MTREEIDIGHGHGLRYFVWKPDRDLNPQYDGLPDLEPAGAIITHPRPDGTGDCEGAINFDVPQEYKDRWASTRNYWQVQTLEPLTVSPSVLCTVCGDHGWISAGRWIPA